MRASLAAEAIKVTKRPAIWGLLATWTTMALTFAYLIPYLVAYADPPADVTIRRSDLLATLVPSGWLGNVISGFPLFGGAFLLIVGALVAGSEYGWGTLGAVLTQGPGRHQVLRAKLMAVTVAALAFEVAVLVLGAAASTLIAAAEDAPLAWPSPWEVVLALGAGWLILTTYGAGGVFLAVLFRSTALPIGLGLVYLLVVASLIDGFAGQLAVLGTVQEVLPRANAGSLASAFVEVDVDETSGIEKVAGPGQATIVLVGYVAAFALLAGQLLRSRDIV